MEEENLLSEEQNGFRKDRRGTDNLYIIREIIDRAKKDKKKYYLAFLDIEKAYDSVNREALTCILRRRGFKSKIVKIIESLYKNTTANYNLGNLQVEGVRSEKGLRQGCTLLLLLFSIFMEELMHKIKKNRNRNKYKWRNISCNVICR